MKALVFDSKLRLVGGYPVPARGTDEVLIAVRVAGVCNTDLEILRGYKGYHGILGHEFVGIVSDSSDPVWIGKRVCAEINIACGQCRFCFANLRTHCSERRVLGILGHDGAFAEYLTVPRTNLHMVPDDVTDDDAVFVEPLAAAFQVLEQVEILPHHHVVVLGDGKLGMLCAQVIASTGADTVLVGKHPEKLVLAHHWGIHTALPDEIARTWADIVVDATGHPTGLESAMRMLRPRGTLVLKTTAANPEPIDLSPLVVQEIQVIGSRCGPFGRALTALQQHSVDVASLISVRYPLCEAEQALEHATRPGVLKVLVDVTTPVRRD